jgi:hypothetical protein
VTDSFLDDLGRQLDDADKRLRASPARPRWPVVRRGRRRAWGRAALVVVAGCAVAVVVLLGGRAEPTDLSARAYAATTRPGIIHWRTEIAGSSGGRVGSRQRTEGWARNGVTHELRFDVVHGKAILQSDSRTAGGRTTTWIRAERDYVRLRARRQTGTDPFQSGDPFAIFRRAYRAGKLTMVGPSRFGVDLPGRSDDAHRNAPLTYYDIDPDSALPIRFVVDTPAGPTLTGPPGIRRPASQTVMTFTVYETLPFNQTTRATLRLLPHPSGGPKDIPASDHFAVLSTGARPGRAAAKTIAMMARRMMGGGRLDAHAARTLAAGMYLLPGPKHVCLIQVSASGGGGSCKTTEEALKRGLGSQRPGRAVFLVVPDGVIAVRARLRGRRYRRVEVQNNVARLPAAAYAWQFLK